MNFNQAIASLGRPKTFGEAIAALRAEHGKATTRVLADRLGVTIRTAQRYVRGQFEPNTRTTAGRERREKTMLAASRRWVAAGLLRRATHVNVGRVAVLDKSKNRPGGTRFVGLHRVGDTVPAQALSQIAGQIQAGQMAQAEEAFSTLMLDAYAVSRGDQAGAASGPLAVSDYLTGIQVET